MTLQHVNPYQQSFVKHVSIEYLQASMRNELLHKNNNSNKLSYIQTNLPTVFYRASLQTNK